MKHTTATEQPQPNQGQPWERGARTATVEPEEAQEGESEQGDQGGYEEAPEPQSNAVAVPGGFRPGYDPRRMDPRKASELARGAPRGPSLLSRLKSRLDKHPEELDELVEALLGAAKDRKGRNLVDAHKVLLDRLDGPVERKVSHTSQSARVVIRADLAPQGAQGGPVLDVAPHGALGGTSQPMLPEVAKGPTQEEAVQRCGGAPVPPSATGVVTCHQGSEVPNGAHLPPGVAELGDRVGAMEAQMGQMMQMMQKLLEQRGG